MPPSVSLNTAVCVQGGGVGTGRAVAVVLALFLTQKLLLTSRQLKRATICPHTWRLQADNGGLCRVPSLNAANRDGNGPTNTGQLFQERRWRGGRLFARAS